MLNPITYKMLNLHRVWAVKIRIFYFFNTFIDNLNGYLSANSKIVLLGN